MATLRKHLSKAAQSCACLLTSANMFSGVFSSVSRIAAEVLTHSFYLLKPSLFDLAAEKSLVPLATKSDNDQIRTSINIKQEQKSSKTALEE